MSATRAFAVLKSTAMILGDKFGFQRAEIIRQNMDQAAYFGVQYDLGGDERGILSASYVPVNGARSHDLNADSLGGLTLQAVIFSYTSDAGTQVTVRVRNTTSPATAATSTPHSGLTVVREVLTLTMASGIQTYQLEVTGDNAANGVYAWGYFRIRKVPA